MRSYDPIEKADWEIDPDYCDKVNETYPINKNRHLLDFVDSSILDFLIGNRDRHGFQRFK